MSKLSSTSLKRLEGVHSDLKRVVIRAREISPIPFEITEGLRTKERQKELVRTGKSKTMNSKHLTGHAIDFVAKPEGVVSWDMKHYVHIVEKAFKVAAAELGVKNLEFGAHWKSFPDGPHVQINV